VFTTKFLRKQ